MKETWTAFWDKKSFRVVYLAGAISTQPVKIHFPYGVFTYCQHPLPLWSIHLFLTSTSLMVYSLIVNIHFPYGLFTYCQHPPTLWSIHLLSTSTSLMVYSLIVKHWTLFNKIILCLTHLLVCTKPGYFPKLWNTKSHLFSLSPEWIFCVSFILATSFLFFIRKYNQKQSKINIHSTVSYLIIHWPGKGRLKIKEKIY